MSSRHAQAHYFRHGRELNWPEGSSSRDSVRAVRKLRALAELVTTQVASSRGGAFADLVAGLLQYEPGARLTPAQALRHPFFSEGSGGAGVAGPSSVHGGSGGDVPMRSGAARTRSTAGERPHAEAPRRVHAGKA
jgi:hypothetical protein